MRDDIVDVIVVGAGFAGLYAAHRLNEHGFSMVGLEAGGDVGGTWYWNRYPGARCDVDSLSYSYSFDKNLVDEWDWSERFATQPEILDYAEWVADKLDLRRHFTFNTRVVRADFDESTSTWVVTTDAGTSIRSRFLVSAAGCLSASSIPSFAGMDDFGGTVLHTGLWPHEPVDFTGKRVAVIGTGSSGIQAIPQIAKTAFHLTVFQRTPHFAVPARNRPLYADERIAARKNWAEIREESKTQFLGMHLPSGHEPVFGVTEPQRREMLEQQWARGGVQMLSTFTDITLDLDANAEVAEFVRAKIRGIVDDPETAAKLSPTTYPIGAKRLCLETDYFATYNQPHVDLVDVRSEPIVGFTETGIATERAEYEFDIVILGTGYDGMTGPLLRMGIHGRDATPLADVWVDGPRTYLGLGVAGFPNLFTITGPGSPSVLVNMLAAIEQHVDWVMECLLDLRRDGIREIEVQPEAQDAWVEEVNAIAEQTLYLKGNSWYLGANIEGKPRVFMPYPGGLPSYRTRCDEVTASGYVGFSLTPAERLVGAANV